MEGVEAGILRGVDSPEAARVAVQPQVPLPLTQVRRT